MDYQPAIELMLAALPDTEAIYRFGSRAVGAMHATSDVDLAILTNSPLDAKVRYDLQERVADRLHVQVDLLDLRVASTVMRVQVLEHGELLFERDGHRREIFEALALSAYARLNEERRAIIDDIYSRGRVHG